jgi:muramoyltetrapeptide carboxypeptidase LdcA involved in peptidoglycan recycling
MKQFVKLTKLKPGDQVAVISPSAGLPGLFPWVHELGLERLQAKPFELQPKEYATTRTMGASPQDRANDIMAAFKDPDNKAVIATIGGEDQIRLIKFLDPEVFKANPKPFFGFSDNTHLHNFLWNLGIPSYYGGSLMTQYAMQGGMNELTVKFIQHALFDTGEFELEVSEEFNDEGLSWADKANLNKTRKFEPNDGLMWDAPGDAEGTLWGGCMESLIVQSTTGKYLPKTEDLRGTILCLESAEDMPAPWIVEYLLMGFGERGWFDQFQAVLIGRPKAWEFDQQKTPSQKQEYRQTQRQTVFKTIRLYNQTIPIVQNLDFGHTDPQVPMPLGHKARLDSAAKKIFLTY